ncbi:MAG: YihY/virulence factor BrkB family protein, partial [Deltaproteobacteria bacterium]
MAKVLRLRRNLRPLALGKQLFSEIDRNNLFGVAAQLAYNFLFSLFPFLIFLVALAAFLPVQGLTSRLLLEAKPFVPTSVYDLVSTNLTALVTHRHGELVTFGLLAAIWSASNGVASLMTGLNLAYAVQETRPFWKTRGIAVAVTLGGGLGALVGIIVLIVGGDVGDWVSKRVGMPSLYSSSWTYLRWPVLAAILMTVLAFLYWLCPNVKTRFRYVSPGAAISTLLWLGGAFGLSFYANHFGNFNATYGSIGTVIVLLTWLYLTGFVLALGGQIN